jgi:hypothetical protein
MTRRSPFLIFFLAFVSAIFIGILIFVYIVTKQTNPIMLDDKGRPQPTARVQWDRPPGLSASFVGRASTPAAGLQTRSSA